MTLAGRSLLAIFAHPDDESFGTGGTFAHSARRGASIGLVCATRGEVGEIADPSLATPETLGAVREAELRCAAETLGVEELVVLDYRDSGMAGTPPNDDPRALVNARADEVVRQLVAVVRRRRPEVVVTFDPTGGYGHPDHVAMHHHAVAAVHAAAVPGYAPELGPAWQAARLFYSAIPRSLFREMRARLAEAGVDTSAWDDLLDADGQVGTPDEDIDLVLDVSDAAEAKWAALLCHRTQFGESNPMRRIPDDLRRWFLGREHYRSAWPTATGERPAGLFP